MCSFSMLLVFFVFFFKQKTAYEMRISVWSSNVCSSDLRTILLLLNLLLMVLMVWAAQGSFVLLQIVAVAGVGWWLLALLWLRFYDFASDHDTHARAFKLAAGTLATLAAWCALVLIHGDRKSVVVGESVSVRGGCG